MKELFGNKAPSIIDNPFTKEGVCKIYMFAIKNSWCNRWSFTGSVEFENGNTRGEQKFEASSLGELYLKIGQFCMSL